MSLDWYENTTQVVFDVEGLELVPEFFAVEPVDEEAAPYTRYFGTVGMRQRMWLKLNAKTLLVFEVSDYEVVPDAVLSLHLPFGGAKRIVAKAENVTYRC